jgi:hypothetical protein
MAGIPLSTAAVLTSGLGAALLFLRLHRERGPGLAEPEPRGVRGRSHWAIPLAIGIIVLLIGVLPSLTHEPLRLRSDARLHLPIIQNLLEGPVPPENPFLAGMPLGYFWFYHVTLAAVARLTPLPLDLVPALFNAQALLVLLLALDRVGRRLGLSPAARAAGLALLGLGLTPWGWVRFLFLQATHPDLNWALVRAWGASALFPILNPVDPRLAAFLTKIAITNALPMSLALAALAATPRRTSDAYALVRHGVLVAGCLALHLATGLFLVAGLLVRAAMERAAPSNANGGRKGWSSLLIPVLALAVTAPYLIMVVQAREGTPTSWGWHGIRALKLHLALIGVWILALPAAERWVRDQAARAWLVVGVPALVLPFAAHLVDGNEYKSLFFLLVLMAPLAGAGLERLARGRTWIMGLVLLPFVPTAILAGQAYRDETPPGLLSPEERTMVREVGSLLPRDAVIWTPDPGAGYFVLTLSLGRSFYLSDPYALQIMGQWDTEEARWRRASLALAGTAPRVPQALAAAGSRTGDRPLYALVTESQSRRYGFLDAALSRLGLRPVARNRLLTLYAVPRPPGP